MSHFKQVIAPELNTYKSTRREKTGILLSFALAATGLCVAAATATTPLMDLLPNIAHKAITIASLIAGTSIIIRFLLTKKEVEIWNRHKYERLQQTAQEYSNKLGLHKTPQIRIWRKHIHMGPAAAPFFHKFDIVFDEGSFSWFSQNQLNAILGHELAHIKKKHLWKTYGLGFLAQCAWTIAPSLGILAPALISLSARQNEFQADRIGVVVSGNPHSLAAVLRTTGCDTSKEKLDDWHSSSVPQKIIKCMLAPAITVFNSSVYLLGARHPVKERRIERLKMMKNAPSKYKTDSLKAWLVRLAL